MNSRKEHVDATGASLLLGFSALLGLNQVCIKFVNAGIAPVFQAGLRSVFAFCVVLCFAYFMHRKLSVKDGSLLPGIATGCLFAFEFTLLFLALDYIDVSRASVLFYTMPFWVTIAARVLIPGEQLTPLKLLGLASALVGIVLTLGDGMSYSEQSHTALLGDFYCLVAAAAWACIALTARTTKLQRSCPEMQLLYQLGVSAPILLLIAFFGGEYLREPTFAIWSVFAFQVVVVVSMGFLMWFWVLSIYPIANMAVFSFLAPVFGVIFGWLLLDEQITLNIMLALVFIAMGIAMVNWPQKKVNNV